MYEKQNGYTWWEFTVALGRWDHGGFTPAKLRVKAWHTLLRLSFLPFQQTVFLNATGRHFYGAEICPRNMFNSTKIKSEQKLSEYPLGCIAASRQFFPLVFNPSFFWWMAFYLGKMGFSHVIDKSILIFLNHHLRNWWA